MNVDVIIEEFGNVFNIKEDVYGFFAPGRVNLIGEHTDYNGGHVFPCALTFGTYAVARKRHDSKLRLFSKNFDSLGIIEADINDLVYDKAHDWANYPKGIVKTFKDAGFGIDKGLDIMFLGNIPNGAGLSSSASIELVTSVALKTLFRLNIEMLDMVKLSQRSENRFNGVNCGIMDQFACGMGRKNHAMLLNTITLEYKYVSANLEGISIVIANTNKRRDLADSKYNERRCQCEAALSALRQKLPIASLGDLSEEEFEENKQRINDEVQRKRAKHAVYENQRTIKAVDALDKGDIKSFGELMNASHVSLRDDYEVTGTELDTLVSAAWKNGAIGSRMTGAGFGGCTVSLVHNDSISSFIENVGKEYLDKIGYKADFYVASIGDGARQI
ncbi:MAG: galactokinase [Clostridia bacterium BRH_c25]|nr:MAG: galactokinase [Clostridia bacterium BRH_c25]